jgi:5-methylcytosine-specific restriction endonuclease McrA
MIQMPPCIFLWYQSQKNLLSFIWKQIKPYKSILTSDQTVLIQSFGRQAAISNLVANLQNDHKSLADAKSSKEWLRTVNKVNRIIETMPLWKIQTLRRQKVIFLFNETLINDGIDLLPGVAYCLRQFNSFILSLTRSAWIKHIKSNQQNQPFFGTETDLEEFMFGTERSSLLEMRGLLTDLQNKKCFYCQTPILFTGAVDHFIPWSRYPRDITQNFVLAHENCNRDKSDLLAASKHLERWRVRNQRFRSSLEQFTNASSISDESTSICVARWAYGHAYTANAQSWLETG